ncbi:MAG TPA: ribonuclease domain-containing protein [Thermoanaerobaculia bacterium]
MHPVIWLASLLAVALGAFWQNGDSASGRGPQPAPRSETRPAEVPRAETPRVEVPRTEASARDAIADPVEREQLDVTLALIERGGPFPHKQDGTVFGNREGRLPSHPRGYYREYTVKTPGARTRGARRVIRGSSGETYYTRDHYKTFMRIDQ